MRTANKKAKYSAPSLNRSLKLLIISGAKLLIKGSSQYCGDAKTQQEAAVFQQYPP